MSTASLYDTHISHRGSSNAFAIVITLLLCAGVLYAGIQLYNDLSTAPAMSFAPYLLLGIALLIALGFEMCNGFHDTSNAVATVIYTHSLPPTAAVIWSGAFNFLGVLTSTGAVAFGIISLLPVELILQVGSGAGFAMVFALLISAIIWNMGTWWFGIPNSSSHALVGSIIGVGIMNQVLARSGEGTSGVDWMQAAAVLAGLRVHPGGGAAAARQVPDQDPGPLQGARRQDPAALVDPRPADPDLHRRQLCPWLE